MPDDSDFPFDYDVALGRLEAHNYTLMRQVLAPYIADPTALESAIAAALQVAREHAGSFAWINERRRIRERSARGDR